jgi:hypothetical protein
MTKTMQELINRANDHKGRGCITTICGRGAKGGRINHGSRETAALRKLVEAGLATYGNKSKSFDSRNGNGYWVYDTVYHLTNQGA